MNCWRITKYNPLYRNLQGHYIKDDWTAYSDIGNLFDGKELAIEEYLIVENRYINAVLTFMDVFKVPFLEVTNLEKHTGEISRNETIEMELASLCSFINERDTVEYSSITSVCKLVLREYIWCKLQSDLMFVHFGYDYYMYIGSAIKCQEALDRIIKTGLFVEAFQSPYMG